MAEYEIDSNGTKRWHINGEYHREDGPAIEWGDGTKMWYKNGVFHREDGPAIEFASGNIWYLNGGLYSFNDYCIKLYGSIDHPKSIMLQVKYG